jgi:hypothetical protein
MHYERFLLISNEWHFKMIFNLFIIPQLLWLFSSAPSSAKAQDVWSPKASGRLTWQWQLQGDIDTKFNVDMYDIDLFNVDESVIQALHDDGRIVVCYFSAGTYEFFRDDWSEFFDFVEQDVLYTGNEPPFVGTLGDFPDERWLDIRRIDLLEPIMKSRLALAASKGCDAVEPDNMDAYQNEQETGISILAEEQLAYNKFIADEAHAVGLSVGLKNDLDQLEDLVDFYDFAVNEQCFEFDECDAYSAFTDRDKAVFGVEYSGCFPCYCPEAQKANLSWMHKKLDLGVWRKGCDDFKQLAL